MLLLSENDVDRLLEVGPAIDATEDAFRCLQRGEAQIPLKIEIHRTHPRGGARIMSGLIGNRILGMKLVGHLYTPERRSPRLSTSMMIIWDAMTLEPRGLIAADTFNNHRTAAGLAAATRILARADARTYAVFGAGKLAFAAVLYVASVRSIERIILSSRTKSRVEALAGRLGRTPELSHIRVETGLSPGEAAAEADIITTVTTSETPVFDGYRVRPGTHINLSGANRRHQREMDDGVAERAVFFLDSRDGCMERSGDVVIPLETGVIDEKQVRGEIGAVFTHEIAGRTTDEEITVFKSLGVAVQDLALGTLLLDKAEATDAGSTFDHVNG